MYYIQRCDEYEGVESESYDTFGRSTVKIRRRAFVSCSRVKACNFSVFVNISSETFADWTENDFLANQKRTIQTLLELVR